MYFYMSNERFLSTWILHFFLFNSLCFFLLILVCCQFVQQLHWSVCTPHSGYVCMCMVHIHYVLLNDDKI